MYPFLTGQEKPSEEFLTPSSRGRPRKKNSRYLDYETEEVENTQQKCRENKEEKTPKRTPARGRKARSVTEQTEGDGQEENNKTAECGEEHSEETPRKPRARKTPSKTTPSLKTPTPAEVVAVDTAQQENGTPKPKRKYVKRKPALDATPVPDPSFGKEGETPDVPEEEIEPGGRRRRGAARA